MSVITAPSTLLIGGMTIGQMRYELGEQSDVTGAQATRLLGPPRWRWSITSQQNMGLAQAAEWEVLIYKLRGRVNHLAVYDFGRPRQGTQTGVPTLNGALAVGDTSMVLTGCTNGATYAAGDWLQVGTAGVLTSQLVKVMATATASGTAMTVTFEPPIRKVIGSGQDVASAPAYGYFKMMNDGLSSEYVPGSGMGGFALDLLEQWS